MNTNETLTKTAMEIAYKAHEGQTRNDKVTPYFTHPFAVAKRLKDQGEPDEVVAAGFLHDVLEDTKTTAQSLLQAGIPVSVVDAVVLLTKPKEPRVSNGEYIRRIKANEIARKVKIADMLHNIGDKPNNRQIMRYARGLLCLVDYHAKHNIAK